MISNGDDLIVYTPHTVTFWLILVTFTKSPLTVLYFEFVISNGKKNQNQKPESEKLNSWFTLNYRKVASGSLSRLVAHIHIFRRLMKGKFETYVMSRGPILRVTSSETRSVCVKQALNTRRWSMRWSRDTFLIKLRLYQLSKKAHRISERIFVLGRE